MAKCARCGQEKDYIPLICASCLNEIGDERYDQAAVQELIEAADEIINYIESGHRDGHRAWPGRWRDSAQDGRRGMETRATFIR